MRLLSKKQVTEKVVYSPQHIARMIQAKTFPAPLEKDSKNGRALWLESDIDDWIRAKLSAR